MVSRVSRRPPPLEAQKGVAPPRRCQFDDEILVGLRGGPQAWGHHASAITQLPAWVGLLQGAGGGANLLTFALATMPPGQPRATDKLADTLVAIFSAGRETTGTPGESTHQDEWSIGRRSYDSRADEFARSRR